jgi:hypothetical protein
MRSTPRHRCGFAWQLGSHSGWFNERASRLPRGCASTCAFRRSVGALIVVRSSSHDGTQVRPALAYSNTRFRLARNRAAELGISPETWDRWVKEQRLPSPSPGFPTSAPRWRWADVDRKMSGKPDNDADAFVASAGKLRNGSKKGRRRALT